MLLSAGQLLLDRSGAAADPYMTLIGYFNATCELAGMARYLGDDVQCRVKSPRKGSGFPRRLGTGSPGQLARRESYPSWGQLWTACSVTGVAVHWGGVSILVDRYFQATSVSVIFEFGGRADVGRSFQRATTTGAVGPVDLDRAATLS